MIENTDLRRLLINFRETVICNEWRSDMDSRKHCVLRRNMIDWLLLNRPETIHEWLVLLPPRLKTQTNHEQFRQYGPHIVAILNRHQARRLRAV